MRVKVKGAAVGCVVVEEVGTARGEEVLGCVAEGGGESGGGSQTRVL